MNKNTTTGADTVRVTSDPLNVGDLGADPVAPVPSGAELLAAVEVDRMVLRDALRSFRMLRTVPTARTMLRTVTVGADGSVTFADGRPGHAGRAVTVDSLSARMDSDAIRRAHAAAVTFYDRHDVTSCDGPFGSVTVLEGVAPGPSDPFRIADKLAAKLSGPVTVEVLAVPTTVTADPDARPAPTVTVRVGAAGAAADLVTSHAWSDVDTRTDTADRDVHVAEVLERMGGRAGSTVVTSHAVAQLGALRTVASNDTARPVLNDVHVGAGGSFSFATDSYRAAWVDRVDTLGDPVPSIDRDQDGNVPIPTAVVRAWSDAVGGSASFTWSHDGRTLVDTPAAAPHLAFVWTAERGPKRSRRRHRVAIMDDGGTRGTAPNIRKLVPSADRTAGTIMAPRAALSAALEATSAVAEATSTRGSVPTLLATDPAGGLYLVVRPHGATPTVVRVNGGSVTFHDEHDVGTGTPVGDTVAERMADRVDDTPAEVVAVNGRYLASVVDVVGRHDGTDRTTDDLVRVELSTTLRPMVVTSADSDSVHDVRALVMPMRT